MEPVVLIILVVTGGIWAVGFVVHFVRNSRVSDPFYPHLVPRHHFSNLTFSRFDR